VAALDRGTDRLLDVDRPGRSCGTRTPSRGRQVDRDLRQLLNEVDLQSITATIQQLVGSGPRTPCVQMGVVAFATTVA
jgi:hypothetical protein